jgi:hypothetical protein
LDESALSDLFDVPDEPFFVRGHVEGPTALSGLIFVGLFPTPMPLGPPLACSVSREPGLFMIGASPAGPLYLLAAGIPWSERPLDFLLNEQPCAARRISRSIRRPAKNGPLPSVHGRRSIRRSTRLSRS